MRVGQLGRVLQALVLEPEDVEAALVAGGKLLVGEDAPAAIGVLLLVPRRLALVPVLRVVAGDELVEVRARHAPRLEGEVLVRAQVVDPELPRPRLLRARLAVE